MAKRMGRRTLTLENRPGIVSYAAVVGGKEGAGPLKKGFDEVSADSYFGQDSWEKAETAMLGRCLDLCTEKAGGTTPELILGGDLLNQCVSSAFAVKDRGIPYLGLYGACSTMAEGLALAALLLDGGGIGSALAFTGSHFCAAERQYRFPLEYGGQRTPTSQWTVTGAGAALLSGEGGGLRITHITAGRVVDAGVTDANNMGAAMAPAAFDTLLAHFADTGRDFSDYDAVLGCARGGLRLRLLRLGAGGAYPPGHGARRMEARPLRGDRGAHVAADLPAGVQHPRRLPCRGD